MTGSLEDPPSHGYDFFISYVKEDRSWAEWIAWQLEAAGFSVSLNLTFLQDGDPVIPRLADLIRNNASAVLVLVSKHLGNQYASEEWFRPLLATRRHSPKVIPIFLDSTPPPPLLRPI